MLTTRIYVSAMFSLCGQQWKLILDMYSLHVVTEMLTSNTNKLSHMHTIHTLTYIRICMPPYTHSHTHMYASIHSLTYVCTYNYIYHASTNYTYTLVTLYPCHTTCYIRITDEPDMSL